MHKKNLKIIIIMKQFKSIIALFILSFTVISCSSDDDSSNDVDTSLIVGEWAINTLVSESVVEASVLGQTVTTEGETIGSDFDYTITFNEDGTLIANGSYTATSTSSVDGQDFPTQTTTVSDINTSGTWSIDGDELTFTGFTTGQVDNDFISGENLENVSIITTLNDTTLSFESDLSDAVPEFDDSGLEGIDFEISGSARASFTRVN